MKIYSNQLILEGSSALPTSGIQTTEQEWFFIYNSETKTIITEVAKGPTIIRSPLTLVVADTPEECQQYISAHELVLSEYLKEN
jgi:hypothetical protein